MRKLLAYSDEITRQPGQRIEFKVSSELPGRFRLDIVRIRCGDDSASGPGVKQTVIEADANGDYPARFQPTQVGSFVRFPSDRPFALGSFTLQAMIWPTLPGKGRQAILGAFRAPDRAGYALVIDRGGALALEVGDGAGESRTVSTGRALTPRRWYSVAATYDAASGAITVRQEPLVRYAAPGDTRGEASATIRFRPAGGVPFLIAGLCDRTSDGRAFVSGLYNGKIDSPRVCDRALGPAELERLKASPLELGDALVAAWDLSRDIPGTRVTDLSPSRHHGETVNLPTRAMKGWNHDGSEMCWMHKPEHYGAIHFHDDDLYDCGWETDAAWTVPDDLPSGAYAAYLTQGDDWFYVPFFVRPRRGTASAKLCLLIATASYYAYVNNRIPMEWGPLDEHSGNTFTVLSQTDLHLDRHPEHGLSLYDNHRDGSGVCYASRLRPFLKMGPREGKLWQYDADTHITDWLEEKGIAYDVVTDDDLDAEGVALLAPYACVMTTTHPEYYSKPMIDALLAYQQRGGRFVYLGGNGFYWRVAYHPSLPGVIEMRRAEDGMRSWIAEPGEYYLSSTGELSGLWRRNGIPPEAVCGTGFSAQGFNFGRPYHRTEASTDPRAAWMFEGIGRDEPIGDFGLVFGGAAGSEIDSVDFDIGTPPHALVVAEATDFGVDFHWVNEEFLHTHSAVNGENCPYVRCDMVFYETPRGGAVFSVSSIAFAGSLSHNRYENNVSRLLGNVLARFLDPQPFAPLSP
jgi:N,N-dimethylformamidase